MHFQSALPAGSRAAGSSIWWPTSLGFTNKNPELKESLQSWENWNVCHTIIITHHILSSKALIMNYGDLPINYITEYSYLSLHLNKLLFARIAQDFKNLDPQKASDKL